MADIAVTITSAVPAIVINDIAITAIAAAIAHASVVAEAVAVATAADLSAFFWWDHCLRTIDHRQTSSKETETWKWKHVSQKRVSVSIRHLIYVSVPYLRNSG